MKKVFFVSLLIACLCMFGVCVSAAGTGGVAIDATSFPDATFRDYIQTNFDTDNDQVLSNTEIDAVWQMNVSELGISDLTGVHRFTNLVHLDCRKNNLTVLNVSKLTKLEGLWCHQNQLIKLELGSLQNMRVLNCNQNQITELDVSDLSNLTQFDCGGNQLTTLNVSNNRALEYLWCGANQLTKLDVHDLPNLISLSCFGNQMSDLNLSNLPALTSLYCQLNQLTELNTGNLTALTDLVCCVNQLTELNVSNLTALVNLDCRDNQLTELDVSSLTNLTDLNCLNNQLPALNLSNNLTQLNSLNCNQNPLTLAIQSYEIDVTAHFADFDITKVVSPVGFEIKNGKFIVNNSVNEISYEYKTGYNDVVMPVTIRLIISIDETNFPDAVFRNYIQTNFDTNGDGALSNVEISTVEWMYLEYKGIADLTGIEYFTNLVGLNCDSNNLTEIDLSSNKGLVKLNCWGTPLTYLDLSQNPSLGRISAGFSSLTHIDLSAQSNLYSLSLDNCSYTVYTTTGSVDLATLPGKFDATKVSNLVGGTITDNILTVNEGTTIVTYDYDTGYPGTNEAFKTASFTLKFEYPPHDHETELRDAVNAELYKEGYSGDLYCTLCGDLIETGSTIPALSAAGRQMVYNTAAGTPEIDGVIDDIWNAVAWMNLDHEIINDVGIAARSKVMYDGASLFVLAEIKDPNIAGDERFEVYLDEDYCRIPLDNTPYCANAYQIPFLSNGDIAQGIESGRAIIIAHQIEKTDEGFVIEIQLKPTTPLGDVVGMEFMYNDSNYENIICWNFNDSEGLKRPFETVSAFGTLILNHEHTSTLIPATSSTCSTRGNNAYYHCTECDLYFTDEAGTTVTTPEEQKRPTNSYHTNETLIGAYDATEDADGYSGDWYCSACGQYTAWGYTIPKLPTPEPEVPDETPNETPDDPKEEEPAEQIPIEEWEIPYTDIPDEIKENTEKLEAIRFVTENEYMIGTSTDEENPTFEVDTVLDRGQFVTILARMAKVSEETVTETGYSDVDADDYYAPFVAWANENEIIFGYGDGTFGAYDEITVEQALVILSRFAAYQKKIATDAETDSETAPAADLNTYADANEVSDWATDAMIWAIDNGLYEANEDGTLAPKAMTSRMLTAMLVYLYDSTL